MDKVYDHKKYEAKIYSLWEKSGAFTPKIDRKKKPFTIILPPPNASGKMHIGNVLMIAIEDLLIRLKRMQGFSTLWVPGTDHAGFETQIKFERKLKEEGKTRFDFDRTTLYQKIWAFVQENKHLIENQIRSMGASVDWTRNKFTLDSDVVKTVIATFKKMYDEGLVYRADYMVNYCPDCGTTFADLEVIHRQRKDSLYFVRYPLINQNKKEPKFIVVATVRPEPIFVDTHLAVNPKDKKNSYLIGRRVRNPLTDKEMEIIGDTFVDPEFGTGIVKLTPAHDKTDYEVARRLGLPIIKAFNLEGRILSRGGTLAGLKTKEAREKVVQILKEKGLLEKVDENYSHSIAICYKAGHDIEPTILPNWFIKVNPLKEPAHEAVKNGAVKIYPKWQEIKYHRWMETMHDWPISRQIVWGIRIPAWYNVNENPKLQITFLTEEKKVVSGELKKLLRKYPLTKIRNGLQTLIAPSDAKFIISEQSPGDEYLQETDTFDTWFSSGQWPLVALGYPNSQDFKYFYPTDILETGWEILRFWVSRMIMFGIYLTGKPPFHTVYLHGLVRALDGRKMSKSLGNEIVPEEYQEEFGTDALRMGLISGTAGGKDFAFPRDKVIAYRNFTNKIWNMARFLKLTIEKEKNKIPFFSQKLKTKLKEKDKEILNKLNKTILSVNSLLESYRFAAAAETIYHFMWEDLASSYIEEIKNRKDKKITLSVLRHVYLNCLKLLHPFMPFITETIWQELRDLRDNPNQLLITSTWPKIS